ncbi:MAG: prephenate dehydratase [Candidatus Aminicenantes bacterium]|nr:prephenate dehydratase [Candidatus Aminicenantes bacterium]
MKLAQIRKNIDQIDDEILDLLSKRMELGLRAKKFKNTIQDKDREKQVLRRMKKHGRNLQLIESDFVETLFREIMERNRAIQEQAKRLIGFQGDHGAFSEVAAKYYDPNLVAIPCHEFSDVFKGVQEGCLDLGIVPVENSLGGSVSQVNEQLIECSLKVIGAVKLRINHCLLALPETHFKEIKTVYSHPQALSQCRSFLTQKRLESRPFYDTAGAAGMLKKEGSKTAAAIASQLCGNLYNLKIIKDHIEDNSSNFTRFFILAKEEKITGANRCSIIFSLPHKAGALFSILEIFARANINLTRVESFPQRKSPGFYFFWLDFERKENLNQVSKILEEVSSKTKMLKYLGCYQEEVFQ